MSQSSANDSVRTLASTVKARHIAVTPKSGPHSATSSVRVRSGISLATVPFVRRSNVEERLRFLLLLNDQLASSVSVNDVRFVVEELRRRRQDRKAVVLPASRRMIAAAAHPHVSALVRACEAPSDSSAIDILRACYRAHYETDANTPSVIGRSLVCAALGGLLLRGGGGSESGAPDVSLALRLLDDAVGDGHVGAMLDVGLCLRDGIGVPADLAAALAWIERAADAGYAPALFELGVMHEDGAEDRERRLEADWGEARGCYLEAAEKGHVEAQLSIGKLLWKAAAAARDAPEGQVGIDKAVIAGMLQKSREWLERAATAGNKEALNLLQCA